MLESAGKDRILIGRDRAWRQSWIAVKPLCTFAYASYVISSLYDRKRFSKGNFYKFALFWYDGSDRSKRNDSGCRAKRNTNVLVSLLLQYRLVVVQLTYFYLHLPSTLRHKLGNCIFYLLFRTVIIYRCIYLIPFTRKSLQILLATIPIDDNTFAATEWNI